MHPSLTKVCGASPSWHIADLRFPTNKPVLSWTSDSPMWPRKNEFTQQLFTAVVYATFLHFPPVMYRRLGPRPVACSCTSNKWPEVARSGADAAVLTFLDLSPAGAISILENL